MAADVPEGRHVPQTMDIPPVALTPETLRGYRDDMAEPRAVHADPARRDGYLRMDGDICSDSRERYLDVPRSSEPDG
jgi:ribose transport system substrate-binding protein